MQDTPNLALPLIAAAQAQKHVTHNEALLAVDTLLQCAVVDKDLASPPASPTAGQRYIVPAGATGAWSGKAAKIAAWEEGAGWRYHTAKPGFMAFVLDESLLYVFNGTAWTSLTSALAAIQNLGRLGIGTVADSTNPFSAKLNKALWTAKTAAEGGDGDLRYTLNKESAADILSLLFQTGFSGRLELGLIGSDNLTAKVSTDGATWRQALSIDAASGGLDFLSEERTAASAATCSIGDVPSRRVTITGGTPITSFGTAPNKERLITFAGALVLTHSATSLILPGGANITTAAGDTATATSDAAGNWRMLAFQRAADAPSGPWTIYTPPVSAQAGSIGSYTAVGAYKQVGKTVHVRASVSIPNAGTATGGLNASPPVAARSDYYQTIPGGEVAVTGKALAWRLFGSTGVAVDYNNATPIANGAVLTFSGTYEAA